MNENLDLTKILKDCPKGTKLYSIIHGDVTLDYIYINDCDKYPIIVNIGRDSFESFTKDGRLYKEYDGECMLFPSKDNRDWSTFKVPNKLPKTWEEFCKNNPINRNEYWIDFDSTIIHSEFGERENVDRNLLPNEEYAKAMLALCQLIQLRNCYNEGWQPNWRDNKSCKYCIEIDRYNIVFDNWYSLQRILAFKTKELRNEFFNNFKDLIEIAKPLL